jgi:gluconate kinase
MKGAPLNDADREEWIRNDEALHDWWKSTHQGISTFIRANRAELDKLIIAVRDAPPPERTWRDYI